MGVQPESRAILGHLLNVSIPFSKENDYRVWALICNTEELEESFDPDTDELHYICETTTTTTLKSYNISMEINMLYQKDNKIQDYYNIMLRRMPVGADTRTEYIRFNKDETMFNTNNQFIGVRRDASVYLNSIGGAADDNGLQSSMTINGEGDGEVGYVTVTNTGTITTYTWTPANVVIPYVRSISDVKQPGFYPGVETKLNSESKLVITGSDGVPSATISALTDSSVQLTGNSATVDATGNWTMSIGGLTAEQTYNLAFKQVQSENIESVTTKAYTVKVKPAPSP